jgi:hypothetical protein
VTGVVSYGTVSGPAYYTEVGMNAVTRGGDVNAVWVETGLRNEGESEERKALVRALLRHWSYGRKLVSHTGKYRIILG